MARITRATDQLRSLGQRAEPAVGEPVLAAALFQRPDSGHEADAPVTVERSHRFGRLRRRSPRRDSEGAAHVVLAATETEVHVFNARDLGAGEDLARDERIARWDRLGLGVRRGHGAEVIFEPAGAEPVRLEAPKASVAVSQLLGCLADAR